MIKSATTNIWSLSRTMCWWKKVSEQWVHHHLSCQRRSRWDNIVGRGANTSWTSSAHLLLSLNPSPCEPSRPSSAFSTCVCLQVGWGGGALTQVLPKVETNKGCVHPLPDHRPVTEPACSWSSRSSIPTCRWDAARAETVTRLRAQTRRPCF